MAKKPYDYIVLRDEKQPVGDLTLSRACYAEPNGHIIQTVSLATEDQKPFIKRESTYNLTETADTTLQLLDQHWNRLAKEFRDIDAQARYYYHAKTGNVDHDEMDSMSHKVLRSMSYQLLDPHIIDSSIEKERLDTSRYPISNTNDRMESIRVAAQDYAIRFDRIEDILDGLNASASDTAYRFDTIMYGGDDAMQPAGQDMDNEEREHHDMPDDELDDPEPDDDHSYPAQSHSHTPLPWDDDDYDPDDERDELIEDSLNHYLKHITHFTDTANQLWQETAQQCAEGNDVTIDAEKITRLKESMHQAAISYDDFKDVVEQHPSSKYELKPVFDAFEHRETGILAQMQKALDILSDQKTLSAVISVKLPARIEPFDKDFPANENILSDNPEHYRNDNVVFDHFRLGRETYVENNGMLTHELCISDDITERFLGANTYWQFQVGVEPDNHMAYIDQSWDKQRQEFLETAKYAKHYADIKTNAPDIRRSIIESTISGTSPFLLKQQDSDDAIAHGEWDDSRLTLVPENFRFMAARESAYSHQLPMDDYETSLVLMHRAVAHAMNRLTNISNGLPPDFNPRKDQPYDDDLADDLHTHPNNSGSTLAGEAITWKAGDGDSWKAGTPYEQDDNEHTKRIEQLIEEYLDNVNAFMDAADQAWLHAGSQIHAHKDVTLPEKPLQAMQYYQKEIHHSYEELSHAIREMELPLNDMASVHELLDDTKDGPDAIAQKLVSIASRPDLLESTIRKGLPKQRGIN
jgi:hypothetical protein